MARVKRGKRHLKRRKNLLRHVKGYMWGRKSKIKLAKTAMIKAGAYAYRDRRKKKSEFRNLWNIRINAAARQEGMSYSRFIDAAKKKHIPLDRKVLAELALEYPKVFSAVVKKIKGQ